VRFLKRRKSKTPSCFRGSISAEKILCFSAFCVAVTGKDKSIVFSFMTARLD